MTRRTLRTLGSSPALITDLRRTRHEPERGHPGARLRVSQWLGEPLSTLRRVRNPALAPRSHHASLCFVADQR